MKFLISLLSWALIGSLVYYMSATTPQSSPPATTTTADVDDSSSTIMNSNKNNNVIKSIISMKIKNSDVEHGEELEKKESLFTSFKQYTTSSAPIFLLL